MTAPEQDVAVSTTRAAVESTNGLSINGLSINGLSINGLSINGLSINGLSTAGLSTGSFSSWFNQNLSDAAMVMSYIVKCSVPSGGAISWQNPATGTSYTWPGELGLAPGWSSGQPATLAEQQIVSACLAAHTNKYGLHVPLAVEGRDATGAPIPRAPGELSTYSHREGCFFGNLFNGQGVFVGTDYLSVLNNQSSPRACAMEDLLSATRQDCSPIVNVGKCSDFCTPDATGVYYTQCRYQGITYLPLATRLLPHDIYTCGDGVCQFTESCGASIVYNNCLLDCGPCPTRAPLLPL